MLPSQLHAGVTDDMSRREGHLRRVLREYTAYCNTARPHQGIGQAVPSAPEPAPPFGSTTPIVSIPVLGGLHHTYHCAA